MKLQRSFDSPYLTRFAESGIFARKREPKLTPVLRKAEGGPKMASNVAAHIQNSLAAGSPLPLGVRRFMEPRFRADFSKVRVHTGDNAAKLNRQLSAQAFAVGRHLFFGKDRFRPETPEGRELIAHELTHTIQQGAAVQGAEEPAVTQRSPTLVQRLGLSDALDYFAERANLIPGFRIFTIILGVNPINMNRVERSAANILRGLTEIIPGGALITQALDNYGIFDRIGAWVEQQINSLALSGSVIRRAIDRFLDSLSWRDTFSLSGVWERARRIFIEPIDRLVNFGRGLVAGIVGFVKEAMLRPLARLASQTRGWDLLKAVLGQDPITGDPSPRNAETLIGGFMRLIGQEEVWNNLRRANAVARAWAWFQGALSGLMGFVRQIPGLFVEAVRSLELADIILLPRAFARVGRVFADFFGRFVSWAGQQVLSLLEIIFDALVPAAMPYLRRAAAAFRAIIQDPIGFIGNLVRAGIQGFRQFGAHFLTHLRGSMIRWLTGTLSGTNIYIPQSFNLREIIKFVLSVLGLTWQNIRQKLVRIIGEPAMAALETTFDIVMTLVREGPAAAWEKIHEAISNLREMVMGQIMTFVRERIVQAAITRLVTSLNPAGAFIQAVIAIYNTIMFFVERLRQIAQVAASFIDSLSAIASGVIATAANRVEQTMAGLLTLVISFMARLVGLGHVSEAVTNIVNRLRAPIDRALDRVVEWIVAQARRLGSAAVRGGRRVAGSIVGWLGFTETFETSDGQRHTLSFGGNEQNPRVMMATAPDDVRNHIAARRANTTVPLTAAQARSLVDAEATIEQIRGLTRRGGQARDETDSSRHPIGVLLRTLRRQLQAGGIVVHIPLSNVTYTTVGPLKAGQVRANPLSARAGNTTGSRTGSSDPPGWASVTSHAVANWNSYVRMHMLCHQLHGPGIAWNLVPAPQSFNRGFMLTRVENPLKAAIDAGAVVRFSALVSYPTTGLPIDDFPHQITLNWSQVSAPPGVTIPRPPGPEPIPPPTFSGAATTTTLPDLSSMGWMRLFQRTGLPADLCRAIGRARASGGFTNPSDFKTRVDQALRNIYGPQRTYSLYEADFIAARSRFVLNGATLGVRDLQWP